MTKSAITTTSVAPLRVARVTGRARSTSHEEIGPLTRQLFDRLMEPIMRQQVAMAGPPVATYELTTDGGLTVTACCPVGADTADVDGLELGELPGLERVAALRHSGSMAGVGATYEALQRWVAEQGLTTDGTAREVYLVSHPEPEERWQTEVQLPIS
ncbi:GyrI-like domain-containing protein [Microlunatus parietis]|uniref:Effector-binding domain-containing protein n=1 Tax=Microlunatus parietis TaxID=682979 RepID=A0A7Y9I4X3_9ACTN|nr:GyrI-like domain-containing protein [Microlunatus parietis]NYE70340.1 effector-binding domain-containing protein [Microlunatus parietis]